MGFLAKTPPRMIMLFLLWAQPGLAADGIPITPPQITSKNFMNSAIHLEITPRGMDIFRTKLKNMIVTQAEFDPSEIYVDPQTQDFAEELRIEDLKIPKDSKKLLLQLRDTLPQWLNSFVLRNLRPRIETGDSSIRTRFSRFALVTDEKLLRSLGKSTGAVLALELEIQESNLNTQFINFIDLNNKFIHASAENVNLNIAGGGRPLKVRIPFYVQINKQNRIEFEALKFESNLNDVNLELKYGKLVVPNVEIRIDDQVFTLNKKQLDQQITTSLPSILVQVRTLMAQFASEELPKILTAKAQQGLVQKLEEVQPLSAPGSDLVPGSLPQSFFWGLQLAQLDLNESLKVQLNAFMEDAPGVRHGNLVPSDFARGAPSFKVVDSKTYDLGISVDRVLINRVLQLSFERGFFNQIPVNTQENQYLRLMQSPKVDAVPGLKAVGSNPRATFLKVKTSVKVPKGSVTGFQKLFLKDEFEMSAEVIARLEEMAYPQCGVREGDRGISILLTKIDLDSIVIDRDSMTALGRLAPGKILSQVRDYLQELSKDWATKGQSVGGCFDPPKELLGIKLDVQQLGVDPNGHLMLFFNYSKGPGRSL